MNKLRVSDIIISAVIAVLLWAYVISVTNPIGTTVVRNVPVQLVGADEMRASGLAIAGSGEYKVDLVVSGTRSERLTATASDFKATADVSGLTIGQGYINVSVSSPATLSVSEIRTQSIQVYVDNYVEKEIEVTINTANIGENQELGGVMLSCESVLVCGAESLVASVEKVIVDIDAGEFQEGIYSQYKCAPKILDSEGSEVVGVSSSVDEITFYGTLSSVKKVALSVPLSGSYPENIQLVSSIIPQSVTIKGTSDALANIWSVTAEAIDLSLLTSSQSVPVVPVLPSGVEVAEADHNLAADFELIVTSEKTFEYKSSEIELRNVPGGYDIAYNQDLEVFITITGEKSIVDGLSKSDVSLYVVLGQAFEGEGDLAITADFGDVDDESFSYKVSPAEIGVRATLSEEE